jgi:hypothetical protein
VLPAASQARSLPAWAALGPRAHPRRHLPWPLRGHPPGRQARRRPPRWSRPQPEDASHAAAAATSRCRLHPCPPRSRPRRALPTPGLAWLVAQRARAAAAARTPTRRTGSATDLPRTYATSGSGARVSASATVARAVDGPAATGASTGSGGQGRPATSTRSPPPPPEGRRRTRPDRRLDTGRLDTAWVDTGRPSAGPAGRRPQVSGQRTAGQPDPGRRDRMGGHRLLDSGDRRRGVPAGRVDHGEDARALDGGWTLLWADAVWGEQSPGPLGSKDAEAPTLPRMGLAAAATVSCRWDAAVPLAPWRTALVCWIWMVRGEGNGTTER